MGFRGEVHHCVDAAHQVGHQRLIGDVALHELQRRVGRYRREVRLVAGIGQLVQNHDFRAGEGWFTTL
jgi:hypothetical protein